MHVSTQIRRVVPIELIDEDVKVCVTRRRHCGWAHNLLETGVILVLILAIGESLSTMSLLLKDKNIYTQLTKGMWREPSALCEIYIQVSGTC